MTSNYGEIVASFHWHPLAHIDENEMLNDWAVVSVWTYALGEQGLTGQSAFNIRQVVDEYAPTEKDLIESWMAATLKPGLPQAGRVRQLQQRLQEWLTYATEENNKSK